MKGPTLSLLEKNLPDHCVAMFMRFSVGFFRGIITAVTVFCSALTCFRWAIHLISLNFISFSQKR